MELADGTIALLGNDDFSTAFEIGIVLLVNLLAEDKQDHVGILLDGAGFAEVGELRAVVAAAAFGSAAELRQSEDGDLELFGEGLKSARDCRHFLSSILEALRTSGHELQVVDDEQVESAFGVFQAPSLGAHFTQRNTGRVIDEKRSFAQLLGGADDLFDIFPPE